LRLETDKAGSVLSKRAPRRKGQARDTCTDVSHIGESLIQVAFKPGTHLFIVDDDELDNHDVDEVSDAGVPVHCCYL